MYRSGGKKTVYSRGWAPYLRKQSAPSVCNGKINRKHPSLKPCGKLMLKPEAELLPPFFVWKSLNALSNFTEGQYAHKECLSRDLFKPSDYQCVLLSSYRLGDNICIEQVAHEISVFRVSVCSLFRSRSMP